MDFVKIRKDLGLSQPEIAILFGIPLANIRNWEQGQRSPDSSVITLYKIVQTKDQQVLSAFVTIACQKRYYDIKEIKSLKRLVAKVINNSLLRGLLEVTFLGNNPQWEPEELGFKVTEITR